MKKYRVNVNGSTYEVEVEELGGFTNPLAPPIAKPAVPPVSAPAPVAKAPAAAPAPAAKAPAAPAAAGAGTITAPMQGKIISVEVNTGDAISNGDVVVILEAMKMENEVYSGIDGTVQEIKCKPGDSVNAGDVLVVIG